SRSAFSPPIRPWTSRSLPSRPFAEGVMACQWYYRRGEQTHGPVSAQQLRELAARGELRADDRVWSEDFDPSRAVPAAKLPSMAPPPAAGAAPPDWLGDVKKGEQQGPAVPPVPAAEGVPDWVEDLRKVAADEEHRPPEAAGTPSLTPAVPEWVGKLDVP